MDLMRAIDGYCERLGPGLWAEPLNALSNLAFLLAALVMWRRCRGPGGKSEGVTLLLCLLLALIGIGSGVFHTFAQGWAALADVVPIGMFILTYLFAVHRDVLGLSTGMALGATALFLPYAAGSGALFARLPWLGTSAGYAPVPLLILIYAVVLRRRFPRLARGFGLGAALLLLSLTARTLDLPLCGLWPQGTHVYWHLLNAGMLAWMIETYRRHLAEVRKT